MEASALKYHAGIGLQGRAPLLRLQSDERLITLVRRGNLPAFEVLVARYQARLLAFCRHLLGSREDAEDVLQEVMTAAFNAMVADERPINVRPWLYRIARNRCLNHLRRTQAIGVDSMDIHLSDGGETTADKVHKAEEFRLLVDDIQSLPETQRTALVLREMDALSYEQISEAMETTVPSVKSLLVRARMSLAEAAQARQLSCEQVRIELAEVAEGLLAKATPPVRRHLRSCQRCECFQSELKRTSRALAALLPLGPLALLKQLAFTHIGHSAGAGASAGSSAGTAAGTGAAVGSGAAAGGALVGAGSVMPIGLGALGVKAAAGLAAAALVTAGAVDLSHTGPAASRHRHLPSAVAQSTQPVATAGAAVAPIHTLIIRHLAAGGAPHRAHAPAHHPSSQTGAKTVPVKLAGQNKGATADRTKTKLTAPTPAGQTQSESISTVMSSGSTSSSSTSTGGSAGTPAADGGQTSTASPPPTAGSGTPTSGDTAIPLGDAAPTGSGSPTGAGSPTPTGDPGPSGSGATGGSGTPGAVAPTDPAPTSAPPPPAGSGAPTGSGTPAGSGTPTGSTGTGSDATAPVVGAPPA